MTQTSDKPEAQQRTAIFPGSFNPYTVGHASVVGRALALFDNIIIAVGINRAKHSDADIDARLEPIRRLYAGNSAVRVCAYDGLTADFARQCGARFILRGVRSVKDFEYERDMADINRRLTGIETVLLYTLPEHAAISSSVVRELASFGADTAPFLPKD